MQARSDRIARVITRLAVGVAVLAVISAPLGYSLIVLRDVNRELEFKARVKATALSGLIAENPDAWMFAKNRLEGLMAREPVPLAGEQVEVFDHRGQLIHHSGAAPAAPTLSRSYPLYDAGRVVGRLDVRASLRGLVHGTVYATVYGMLLGALVFLIVRTLPLRALRHILKELYDEKERTDTTLQAISDAVIRTDAQGRIRYLNLAAQAMLGITLAQVDGQPIAAVVRLRDDKTHAPLDDPLAQAMAKASVMAGLGRSELCRPDQSVVAVEEYAAPIFDETGVITGGVLVLRDVSLTRAFTEQRAWEATHDALTGLFNRREFESRVKAALRGVQASGEEHVICFLDLDAFKVINDTGGHTAGDQFLIQLAHLLRSCVRDSDTLARLGGDEFGVLLHGCEIEHAKRIAADLLAAIKDFRMTWESKVFSVGVSIGLTVISPEHLSAEEVIGEADNACYWAKDQGRNRIRVFLHTDKQLAQRRVQSDWVARIREAFDLNRFVLYQQTYLNLSPAAGENAHLEVLLRMEDGSGGFIEPEGFLNAAERYNLMPEIDRWVIRQVFSHYHALVAERGGGPLTCCINLSGASINTEGFFDFIRQQIERYQPGAGTICFELTENVAINNLQATEQFIRQCKSLGIEFALDDFGIGNSSLGYLKNLSVDYLKIDGGFIRNIERDKIDLALAETVNRIGHILGKKTVAEHVENDAIIHILRAMGIDYAQGNGVCRPTPLLSQDRQVAGIDPQHPG